MILKTYQKYQTDQKLNKQKMVKEEDNNLIINGNQFRNQLNIQTEVSINQVQGCQQWDEARNLQMSDKVVQGHVPPLKVKY